MKPANELLMKPSNPGDSGQVISVGPEQAGWEYIGLEIHRVAEGETFAFSSPDDELCIVPMVGEAIVGVGEDVHELGAGDTVTYDCTRGHWWKNPFEEPAELIGITVPLGHWARPFP